ncbi:MAG: tail fiber domain-containing protein [Proteobacteria bacterium]|nr:tail fiber domain-containing protein [Pseudomonadota bacterium]
MKCLTGLLLLILPLFSVADVVVPTESVENHVNIRMSADPQSDIVGRLSQGDYLPLVKSIAGWHEVAISGGATGFISADWSVVLDEPPEPKEAAAEGIMPVSDDVEKLVESSRELDEPAPSVDAVAAEQTTTAPIQIIEQTAEKAVADAIPDAAEVADVVGGDSTAKETDGEVLEEVVVVVEEPAKDVAVEVATELPVTDHEVVAEESAETTGEPTTAVVYDSPAGLQGLPGIPRPQGPKGDAGPPGPSGAASIEGSVGFLTKFTAPTIGGSSGVYDDGNNIGIGTTEPKQRLEVNGNIQIHERNSSVAGLMITQSDGETGYIMHNRASTLTIGAGSVDRITIDREGNVGIGVSRPKNPIEMASGAHVTAGGVWTNSSSRARKENIHQLSLDDAISALADLEPVQFNYKNDHLESYVGFIAEDVPDLVATSDRDGLSSMDIVAVLTRIVQEQQKKIAELEARLDRM